MRVVSFDSDYSGGDGASPTFFPRSVFCFPLPSMLRCALGVGLERIVFGDFAN